MVPTEWFAGTGSLEWARLSVDKVSLDSSRSPYGVTSACFRQLPA